MILSHRVTMSDTQSVQKTPIFRIDGGSSFFFFFVWFSIPTYKHKVYSEPIILVHSLRDDWSRAALSAQGREWQCAAAGLLRLTRNREGNGELS